MFLMEKFGDRLKSARKKAGLSQKALAGQIGSHPNTIASYERNEKEPGIGKIRLIGTVLQCDLNWLVYGKSLEEMRVGWTDDAGQSKKESPARTEGQKDLISRLQELSEENQEIVSEIVGFFLKKEGKK